MYIDPQFLLFDGSGWTHMFTLDDTVTWTEKVLRPVIVYAALVIMLRVFGKRELAQLNPFDLVVILSLSNTVQNAIIGPDNSLVGGLVGAVALLLINFIFSRLKYSSSTIEAAAEGIPVTLVDKGNPDPQKLRSELITQRDLDIIAHQNGVENAEEIEKLVLEPKVRFWWTAKKRSKTRRGSRKRYSIKVGDIVDAVVLTIDREERKMSLGIKQLTEDPWTRAEVLTKYAIGTTHKGIVRNLTNFGLFLELEEGIDGLVHVSDLSWTKKVKHPSEFTKVGETLEVKVLELDAAIRRLALSHKHMEQNPWDTFETIFTPGSVHKGTVVNKNEKGMVVELQYGIEGFCTIKNIAKQDNGKTEIGESLDFKVLEFSKEDRRISLSHKATWSTEVEEKPAPQAAPKRKPETKGKTIANINQQSEKSTLGDLEALSALKEKMSAAKSAPASGEEPKSE